MQSAQVDFDAPLSPGQRRAIFAAGRARGLGLDDLRSMTPAGSVSSLTAAQAAGLLDRLNAGGSFERARRPRPPRRPAGVIRRVTAAQMAKIEQLRLALGWERDGLERFLAQRRHSHGAPMNRILTALDAQAVIGLLRVVAGQVRRRPRDGAGDRTEQDLQRGGDRGGSPRQPGSAWPGPRGLET